MTAQGISLDSYLHLKLSFHLICFLFNKIREQEARTGFAQKRVAGGGEVAQIMYTHVSKCKSDKNKIKRKEKF
jgi:hypothetical protein